MTQATSAMPFVISIALIAVVGYFVTRLYTVAQDFLVAFKGKMASLTREVEYAGSSIGRELRRMEFAAPQADAPNQGHYHENYLNPGYPYREEQAFTNALQRYYETRTSQPEAVYPITAGYAQSISPGNTLTETTGGSESFGSTQERPYQSTNAFLSGVSAAISSQPTLFGDSRTNWEQMSDMQSTDISGLVQDNL